MHHLIRPFAPHFRCQTHTDAPDNVDNAPPLAEIWRIAEQARPMTRPGRPRRAVRKESAQASAADIVPPSAPTTVASLIPRWSLGTPFVNSS